MNPRASALAPDSQTAAARARFLVFGKAALASLTDSAPSDPRAAERDWLSRALGTPAESIYSLHQVHGDRAVEIERAAPARAPHAEGDALFTADRGVALVIRTADCLPLFFELREPADAGRLRVGVIHAGWRGMDAAVIRKTLQAAAWPDAAQLELRYAIGPCISGDSYEVDADVAARFSRKQARANGKFLVDLPAEAELQIDAFTAQLRLDGRSVKTLAVRELFADNYQNHARYYSHRRGDSGRNLNVALLP